MVTLSHEHIQDLTHPMLKLTSTAFLLSVVPFPIGIMQSFKLCVLGDSSSASCESMESACTPQWPDQKQAAQICSCSAGETETEDHRSLKASPAH